MKSLLHITGEKTGLDIKTYIDKTNKDIEIYCEPFAGSCTVGLTLAEQGFEGKIILNDLDKSVYNFFNCLKEDWERLFKECRKIVIEMAEEIYTDDMIYKIKTYRESDDKYKQAASEYVYRKSLVMSGFSVNFRRFQDTEIDFFIQSQTLQSIELLNSDYKEIIDKYDSDKTFMFIDPPYNIGHVTNYYRCDSNLFYHRELSNKIKDMKSKFLLTYNDNMYIRMLYENYNIREKHRIIGKLYTELYIDNI